MFFIWHEMLPNRVEEIEGTISSGLCWQNYMFIKNALGNGRSCESKPHKALISREHCLPLNLHQTYSWLIFLGLAVNEAITPSLSKFLSKQELRRAESCVLMCSLERPEFKQGLQITWTLTDVKEKCEACDACLRGTCPSIAQVFLWNSSGILILKPMVMIHDHGWWLILSCWVQCYFSA